MSDAAQLPMFTIAQIEQDSADLTFESFDQEAAYALGTLAAEIIRERELTLSAQVVLGEHIVYKAALGGVPEGTTEWLRRKANVAKAEAVPSLLVRLREDEGDTRFSAKGLDEADYAISGGSFPIVVEGAVVGTLTLSGEPDVVDHEVATAAVRSYLGN